MMKENKYLKRIHVAVLLCFLFPFFHTSCEDTKTNEVDVVSMETLERGDSLMPSDAIVETHDSVANTGLSKKISIFNFIISPSKDVYTGLGTLITQVYLIPPTSVFICFLLLIIGLIIKFIEAHAKKTLVVIDVFALLALLISIPHTTDYEKLWGFWVTLFAIAMLTFYDLYQLNAFTKNNKHI